MNAECARPSCAQQATVLLAYDPRGATAWLRDLADGHPSMGLMLCGDHADGTSVPLSWQLIDERSPGYEFEDSGYDEDKAPSFDDIFPPRAAPEPDPYGLDLDLEVRQPTMTQEETDEAIARDPDVAALMVGEEIDETDTEAVELLAPELPASGTDGRAVGQPQLPMIATPPTRTSPPSVIEPPVPGAGYDGAGYDGAGYDMDFLFEEQPDDQIDGGEPQQGPQSAQGPHSAQGPQSAQGLQGPHVGTQAQPGPAGGAPNGQVVSRQAHASPLFGKTDVSPQGLNVPPSATLLSRAFRTAQFD